MGFPFFSSSPLNTLFLPAPRPAPCDMHYTDQCNGSSGSLAAHLPFSFYPVSVPPGENSLHRSSLPPWCGWSASDSQLRALIKTGYLPACASEFVFTSPASCCLFAF